MTSLLTEPAGRYTRVAAALHWLVAALIAANVTLGLTAELFPDAWVRPMIDLHKSIGLTVLGLVLLRLLWRASHPAPELPVSYPWLERAGAHATHIALYVLILALPISGWLHDSAFKDAAAFPLRIFWVIPWFRIGAIEHLDATTKETAHSQFFALHAWSGYALYALVALHVLGALKHQFLDGEAELQRMRIGRQRGG
jgi:cytochrome b561